MTHLISPRRSPSARHHGPLVPLTWALRLLILLAGITAMHLWIGPPVDAGAPTHGSSQTVHVTASDGSSSVSSTVMGEKVLAAVSAPSPAHGSSEASLCDPTCPNGHSMMDALCLIALLVVGIAGCLWLRTALLGGFAVRRGPPVLALTYLFRPQTVSLVQLSISRT